MYTAGVFSLLSLTPSMPQFIWIVFNTAMIFPRRAYVSVEHFPLAKRFSEIWLYTAYV